MKLFIFLCLIIFSFKLYANEYPYRGPAIDEEGSALAGIDHNWLRFCGELGIENSYKTMQKLKNLSSNDYDIYNKNRIQTSNKKLRYSEACEENLIQVIEANDEFIENIKIQVDLKLGIIQENTKYCKIKNNIFNEFCENKCDDDFRAKITEEKILTDGITSPQTWPSKEVINTFKPIIKSTKLDSNPVYTVDENKKNPCGEDIQITKNNYLEIQSLFSTFKEIQISYYDVQEKKRIAEEKAAEEKRIAEEKRKEEERLAEEKAAEEKRIADEKAAEEKRIADEKAAEEKRIADEKAAEEKRIVEEKKSAEELIERKLSLFSEQTEIEKAQDFLKNAKSFLKLYPDELDIITTTEYIIATKPIIDGNINEELNVYLTEFRNYLKTSVIYEEYENEILSSARETKLKKVNDLIFEIENNIWVLKKFMIENQNSVNLEDWLNNVKVAEEVILKLESYQGLINTSKNLKDLINLKREIDVSIDRTNKSIESLKSYLRDYQESELAPLILDQVKQLKEAIASENIDQMNNSNTLVEEFIYEKFIKPEEERIAEEKRKEEERIAEEKKKADEEKKKLIEDKYKKFNAKNDFQKNIIKLLHIVGVKFENIQFSRKDNNIELTNLNIGEVTINRLELVDINRDYLDIFFDLTNRYIDSAVFPDFFKIINEFNYGGKIFSDVTIIDYEQIINEDVYLKISEINFSDLDFKKYDQVKNIITSSLFDDEDITKSLLSFILSMKFEEIYFRDLIFKEYYQNVSIEYLEISDWNELSFENILINKAYFQNDENELSFDSMSLEDYLFDSEEINKLIGSNKIYEELIIDNDFSKIFNSLKSFQKFEIINFESRIENSDFYSFESAKIKDLEFNYFGENKNIKVPTSLQIEIIGSSLNPSEVNREASILANELGYNNIKFDFITSWFWDTKKNNIEFNLENGLTDAGSISILTNITDLNSDILSLQGAPLMTYLMTTPKLKEFNITILDKSLKDKIIAYGAKQQNMSSNQYKNFLSQSLSLLATTIGISADNYEEYFTSISNFINDSNKLKISLEPNKPLSVNDLMPDIMSQNYSSISEKINLEIKN